MREFSVPDGLRRGGRSLWLLLAVLLCPELAWAQQPGRPVGQDTAAVRRAAEQRLGRSVSQAEIVERLRESGMTRAQARARLQQAGYDPGLADRYFDIIERGGEAPRGEASEEFLEALGRIGVTARSDRRPDATRMPADTLDDELLLDFERELQLADTMLLPRMEVFGLRTFRRSGTQFRPLQFGPVDPGYRLGPGDEILLVLTGDVEAAYHLDVTREGHIFIPDVGQLSVAGLTLRQLEDQLYNRLGRVYSGISRSAHATTRFQVTLGQLRTIQVFVRGEVMMPGAYQVSSVAGLFSALYQAGGPTEDGSFRRVEVHRSGVLMHTADLYEFLVGGSVATDIRLEHGDHVFVPPAGAQVRVEGSVRRPAIYEMRPEEGVTTVLRFAGGLRSDALVRRVQIDRVLPPERQRPGHYRTLVDVDLSRLALGAPEVPLVDGDIVNVFVVNDERRNRVWLEGEVRHPGLYEWEPGSTLWSVLERADGLSERAYLSRAHVHRLVERDGARRLIPVSLEQDASGLPLHDLPLADNDSIVVLSRVELGNPEFVVIDGFVKFPDTYALTRGMSLKDLILTAGGFVDGAYMLEAELSRLPDPLRRSDTTAHVVRIPLDPDGSVNGELNGDPGRLPHWLPRADDVELRHADRIFVRRAPGYEPVRQVRVTGQVMTPGTYVLATRDERLADVIERAGGLTPQAYARGMHVVRGGRIVAASLDRALRNGRDRNNLLLADGDSIHVPPFNPTVVVTGAVHFEASVVHVPGRSLQYYIDQAGGYTDRADRRRVSIAYPSGERGSARSGVFEGRTRGVEPGSQIFVPARPDGGMNWDQVVGRAAAVISAAATLLIGLSQIR